MAPVYVKGGIWTNVEDEILKASISKYGLNQWARVSSLLAKKTAKQCKARWFEWLDPTIKKLEWSAEEDEKLLRLVKLLPNQWRSIAPIVGRTPTQCIERYQKLLDEMNDETTSNELGLQGSGIETMAPVGRNLRIGDINANPESKPARPDAVNMDDEEKEMLSEARARLANTQGKKAKRKARERMLDESRRISLLQKRRELKNAGINIKLKKNKKNDNRIDYNADIPLYQKPPTGFFDTSEEIENNLREQHNFENKVKAEGIKNIEFEKQTKNEKRKKQNERKRRDNQQNENQIEENITKRRKLVLPKPEISSNELDAIIKVTDNNNNNEAISENDNYIGDFALKHLATGLDESRGKDTYKSEEQVGKGIKTEMQDFQQRTEAQNLLPSSKSFPTVQDSNKVFQVTESNEKSKESSLEVKNFDLAALFGSLPKPEHDYESILPELIDDISEEDEEDEQLELVNNKHAHFAEIVDEGERSRLLEIAQKQEMEKAASRRSQVLQRSLPIPNILEEGIKLKKLPYSDEIDSTINDVMTQLIRSDFVKKNNITTANVALLDDLDDEIKTEIDQKIREEELQMPSSLSIYKNTIFDYYSNENYRLPGLNGTPAPPLKQVQLLIENLKTISSKSSILENRFREKNESYEMINKELISENEQIVKNLMEKDLEYAVYEKMLAMEKLAIENRRSFLQESVDQLVRAETFGQMRYEELKNTNTD